MSDEQRIDSELAGKTAVVTGSSSGIGQAMALELAAGGAAVVVHCRKSVEAAERVAAEVRGLRREALVIASDLTDAGEHESFVEQAWNWRGGVDVWINNAGADVLTGDARGWSFEEKLATLWRVDVLATMRLSRLIGERMRQRGGEAGGAVILNMGWDQAEVGMAGDSGEMFAAVKGAVMAFSKSLAQSLAPHVRVNCLAPGWIRTSWGEHASAYWQERAARESLLGRWGMPEDVARVARFVSSPAASFITGQIIAVNGGFRARDAV